MPLLSSGDEIVKSGSHEELMGGKYAEMLELRRINIAPQRARDHRPLKDLAKTQHKKTRTAGEMIDIYTNY